MKRTLVLTFLALLGFTAAQAQKQVAILTHGDNVTVFYGTDALVSAHAAATAGDIITLSSGVFNATNISKNSIVVRGAGMYPDTTANIQPTVVSGELFFSGDSLTIEGIRFTHMVKSAGPSTGDTATEHSRFVGCYFHFIEHRTNRMDDCEFIQCILRMNNYPTDNTTFTNCVVFGSFGTGCFCNNCVMDSWNNNVVANNSIILTATSNAAHDNWSSTRCDNTNMTNCISIGNGSVCAFTSEVVDAGNYGNSIGIEVFKTLRRNQYTEIEYTYGERYMLTEETAATYLGSDGTQVGIYGGQAPFSTSINAYRINVPQRSNSAGKLNVTIEAITE